MKSTMTPEQYAARDKYMQQEYDKITPGEWNEYYAQLREEREERNNYENTDFASWDSDSGL